MEKILRACLDVYEPQSLLAVTIGTDDLTVQIYLSVAVSTGSRRHPYFCFSCYTIHIVTIAPFLPLFLFFFVEEEGEG